jgi:hypothetical protein
MRLGEQVSGIYFKKLGLVSLLVGGLCVSAFAQSPSLSLPALPPLPGAPATNSGNLSALPSINLPSVPQAPIPAAPDVGKASALNLPSLPVTPPAPSAEIASAKTNAEPVVKGSLMPLPNAAAAKPPADPEGDMVDTGSSAVGTPGSLPPQGMPALPIPGAEALAVPLPPTIPEAATSLPEIDVACEKPKVKTWLSKLAPSIIPPVTNFNYKREVLSEVIYSTRYSRENSHLPMRMTREDYEAMLFTSVAKNDIEATRALLNAGTGLQVTNDAGETPLAAAKRAGAVDVAALLEARGAK